MAEEVKAAQEAAGTPPKNSKVNRLKVDELNRKIKEMEEKNLVKSRYYKHLLMRKKELGQS
jgi:hypothetical protein